MQNPVLSIVLPCYNEAENIPLILRHFREAKDETPAELILVDNGSTDHSKEMMARELSKPENCFARSVEIIQNKGYGDGIFRGLCEAKGEFLSWSHADLQCPPRDLFIAYHKLASSPNPEKTLVKGRRLNRPPAELFVTRMHQTLASLFLREPLEDINGQPKVFHRSLLSELRSPPIDFSFDLYVLYKARRAGLEIQTIPVDFGKRQHGRSHWASNIRSRLRTYRRAFQYILELKRAGE